MKKFYIVLILISFVLSINVHMKTYASSEIEGCSIFPDDNIWNTPVDKLPVDPNSSTYINTIGAATGLHPDFGSGNWNGGPIGIPYTVVSVTQPMVNITFDYAGESDPGLYPIPPDALVEGGSNSTGDRHVLILEKDSCILYELYDAHLQPDNSWHAGSGAVFDLKSHKLRPDTWTSADAAGLPILPGLVRYDEVISGEIKHALRFTVPQTRKAHIWPARHDASDLASYIYPPMGQRFRLKADYDISRFSMEVQTILKALKEYGMFIADNGSGWFISGVPDPRWDNDILRELRQVNGSDFEAVDESSLMIDKDSGQAIQDSDSNIVPGIKANNTDGSVAISAGDQLTVAISLISGDNKGVNCDWWAVASTPFGWYYLDAMTMSWLYAGDSYTALSATYQGTLFDLGTYSVLNISGLPIGLYTFYFAIDTNVNGVLDLGSLLFDSVVVNITP